MKKENNKYELFDSNNEIIKFEYESEIIKEEETFKNSSLIDKIEYVLNIIDKYYNIIEKNQKVNIPLIYIFFSIIISFIAGYLLTYYLSYAYLDKTIALEFEQKLRKLKPIEKPVINPDMLEEINIVFKRDNKVNVNSIEAKYIPLQKKNKEIIKNIIHLGFTLDSEFILETMLTLSSIMKSQNKTTKIVFHFGVVKNFTCEHILKLYELKYRVNNLTEFNFYYLKDSTEKMKNFGPKGEDYPGKFELPQYLPDNVERLIIFDAGDLMVFRDLSDLFKYEMGKFVVLGVPEPWGIYSLVQKYNITKYISLGCLLINVKKFKINHIWDKYLKNLNLEVGGDEVQTLFNIVVPDNQKNYLPFRFGGYSILCTDKDSENLNYKDYGFKKWLNSELAVTLPENPGCENNITARFYNPVYMQAKCEEGKWILGRGLSIYRHLVKYFIKVGGIWDELCKKRPGYCS